MEITIKRTDQKFQFKAKSETAEIDVCATPEMGDNPVGFRPMELQLVALGGCLSIDVLQILYKQKQQVLDYDIKVAGSRKEELPGVFDEVLVTIHLKGNIDPKKIERAIELGVEKYCSVYHILRETAKITCNYTIEDGEA